VSEERRRFTPSIHVFRPDRPGLRKVLGDLEAEVMEIVWARPRDRGTTVRDVARILQGRRPVAYTTVMTTMARLARKGLLRVEKRGLAYVYFPAVSEDEFVSGFVGRILEDLLMNFSGVTVERLRALADSHASRRVRRLLDKIVRRRGEEE